MLELIARHGFITIFVAIILEELSVPMPIPTDVLIVLAGTSSGLIFSRMLLWYCVISLSSAIGATGLYFLVRRGGRPLVERYGRYVHLGPEQLARAESTLNRGGWIGIAAGRATPGLRYVTVIGCGLLKVPYWRFITAHLVGSSFYIWFFLTLGAAFGPRIVERIHLPHTAIRLIWLLTLGVVLPLILVWCARRARIAGPTVPAPSLRRSWSVLALAGSVGTVSLTAIWASATAAAALLNAPHRLPFLYQRMHEMVGRVGGGPRVDLIRHAVLALVLIVVAVIYYSITGPRVRPSRWSLPRQVLGLVVFGTILGSFTLIGEAHSTFGHLANSVQVGVLLLSVIAYAIVTVYLRALVLTILPATPLTGPIGLQPVNQAAE
ncbi:hypothetical protein BH10CHL1_BH10CHL1_26460 [soil metagenome]